MQVILNNTSKYKKENPQTSIYKNSISKVSLVNKYDTKSRSKIKTKTDYMTSSYRKSNISSTHKKYLKKARVSK